MNLISTLSRILKKDVDFASVIAEPLVQKILAAINYLVDVYQDNYKIGTIVWSPLTLIQWQAGNTGTWVQCDNTNIVGEDLETEFGFTNSPNAVGRFVRGLDNGRGVDSGRVMSSLQDSKNTSHQHFMIHNDPSLNSTSSHSGSTPFIGTSGYRTSGLGDATEDILAKNSDSADKPNRRTTSTGVTEARPYNIQFNMFIKVSE